MKYPTKEELKSFFDHVSKVACATTDSNIKDLDYIAIDEYGDIEAQFSQYNRGETNTWSFTVTQEELYKDIDSILSDLKIKKQKQAEGLERKKAEQEIKDRKAKEKAEHTNYLRLKKKFESN